MVIPCRTAIDFSKRIFPTPRADHNSSPKVAVTIVITEGDVITMVSATFGDELWSARGVGKMRLEKSIAVRQGMTISFVFEDRKGGNANLKKMQQQAEKQARLQTRLQKQLQDEVDSEKKKGWFR
jgi:hypothetical protein